ncbi:SMP-30/gluconolactonase/LRE family protein, partial [Xanthomonas oryzae pv. oryzae]
GVYRLPPDGGALQCMVNLDHPNGLAFSPDERVLYVSQTPEGGPGAPEITALDWHDGALHNRRRFAVVPEGLPDGFCVDCQGWLWSSSGAGVCVFDSGGHVLGLVPTPHTASNCTFDLVQRRLFITGGSTLWLLDLQR